MICHHFDVNMISMRFHVISVFGFNIGFALCHGGGMPETITWDWIIGLDFMGFDTSPTIPSLDGALAGLVAKLLRGNLEKSAWQYAKEALFTPEYNIWFN